jgi:hypothetical protein
MSQAFDRILLPNWEQWTDCEDIDQISSKAIRDLAVSKPTYPSQLGYQEQPEAQ